MNSAAECLLSFDVGYRLRCCEGQNGTGQKQQKQQKQPAILHPTGVYSAAAGDTSFTASS